MISVIIPAHNEAKVLGSTLTRLFAQLPQNTEVIVVCDCCDDESHLIAKQYGAQAVDAQLRSAAAARNYGVKFAQGDTLVFLDADTEVSSNFFQTLDSTLLDVGYGTAPLISETGHWLGRFIANDINRFNLRHFTVGGNCFVSRSLFEQLEGFNVQLAKGEDTDFGVRCQQQGGQFYWLEQAHCVHNERRFKEQGYIYHYLSLLVGGLLWQLSPTLYRKIIGDKA